MTTSFQHVFKTDLGFCGAVWNARGLTHFVLPLRDAASVSARITTRATGASEVVPDGEMADLFSAVRRYFAGSREDFSDVPIDLEGTDAFRCAIYLAAQKIGYGETITYGGLAQKAGFPNAARETGTAMGANPFPLIVPCHRVLAAGGKLGGFSSPGGVETKKKMLGLEKAQPPHAEPAQAIFPF